MVRRKITKKSLVRQAHGSVKRIIIPHRDNDYRPYLIRGVGIAAIMVVVAVIQLSYNFVQTGSVLGVTTEINSQQLLSDTNSARREIGEKDLKLNTELSKAADQKANDMFAHQYWAHTSPTGVTPWQWFEKAGYQYAEAGENLARGFHTSDGVVQAWMGSQEHRDNILNANYTEVGFAAKQGVLNGKKTTLVVALYGEPKTTETATTDRGAVLAAQTSSISPVSRLGVGLQSLTPAVIGSIVLLLIGVIVALVAHIYRKKLPFELRQSWRRHHGLYQALGLASVAIVIIALYGGGQI